ncbi:AAA family ATPase [Candidatus Marithrix sp. Canyon 246]|uniref:AAA family ATPase n=1 Tax=Candidatus Marithrix sp. Canyon 246 TaxID=1827136 RepID=UPI00084A0E7E|nr:AAA family ATPase [Candidatus Marithrix sp. Canyon 246]
MKIKNLSLKNFTAFEQAKFNFCDGINVLIGTNGTGKTHAMKAIYAVLNSLKTANMLSNDLEKLFNIHNSNELIRNNNNTRKATTFFSHKNGRLEFSLGISDGIINPDSTIDYKSEIDIEVNINNSETVNFVYLPTVEMLSIYDHFFATYERKEIPYDSTCYDLALALNAATLRNTHADYQSVEPILKHLQEIITDSKSQEQDVVVKESEHFYFNLNGNKLDVNLVADGYRKLGTLFYLLRNGSLTTNSILFWDEPEANLNPKLIVKVAKVLQALADSGMQIFIATHDYLLSHELSLLAEYPSENPTKVKFFSLHKPNHDSSVMTQEGDSLADISHNPILEEFADYYDREVELFSNEDSSNDTH